MAPANPDDEKLAAILRGAHTIAVVGASSKPEKSSHGIMKRLQALGYRVIPVNPNEDEVLGEKSYASLRDIPMKIDIVDVFRRAESTPPVAADAAAIGAGTLWLQLGIANDEAAAIAAQAGLNVVMDNCIAVTHRRLNIPQK
jgi:predicted CoA-binding protein